MMPSRCRLMTMLTPDVLPPLFDAACLRYYSFCRAALSLCALRVVIILRHMSMF